MSIIPGWSTTARITNSLANVSLEQSIGTQKLSFESASLLLVSLPNEAASIVDGWHRIHRRASESVQTPAWRVAILSNLSPESPDFDIATRVLTTLSAAPDPSFRRMTAKPISRRLAPLVRELVIALRARDWLSSLPAEAARTLFKRTRFVLYPPSHFCMR